MHSVLLPGTDAYDDTILATPGLVGYWPLDESMGTIAWDRKGTNHATYTAGFTLRQGGPMPDAPAVLLNGVNGTRVRAAQITIPAQHTWEAWANPVAYPGDAAMIGQWAGSVGSMLYFTSTLAIIRVQGTATSFAVPAVGFWHHWAGTYDGTNLRLYMDGALVSGPTAASGLTSPAVPLDMGTYSNDAGGNLNARLARNAVYSRALPVGEVRHHTMLGFGR